MTRHKVRKSSAPFRRPTNLSLDAALVAEAKELGLNLSQACELGLIGQIAQAKSNRWCAENEAALSSSNAFVDEKGLPLAALRPY